MMPKMMSYINSGKTMYKNNAKYLNHKVINNKSLLRFLP